MRCERKMFRDARNKECNDYYIIYYTIQYIALHNLTHNGFRSFEAEAVPSMKDVQRYMSIYLHIIK